MYAVHSPADAAPEAVRKVPGGQGLHAARAAAACYAPGAQSTHASPPPAPADPGLHTQFAAPTLATTVVLVFAGHGWHASSEPPPSAPRNVLTGHAEHVSSAVAPTAAENLPRAHAAQSLATTEPLAPRYVPAGQSSHACPPTCGWNLSSTHSTHADSPPAPKEPGLHTQLANAALSVPVVLALAGHSWQAMAPALPTACRNEPCRQSVHAAAPGEAAYVQSAQAAHKPAPVGAENPASYAMQTTLPVPAAAVPGQHRAHGAFPATPAQPSSHGHADRAALGEENPRQVAQCRAPGSADNVPPGHAAHALSPEAFLCEPTAHGAHAASAGRRACPAAHTHTPHTSVAISRAGQSVQANPSHRHTALPSADLECSYIYIILYS